MIALNDKSLGSLPPTISVPAYDRSAVRVGIVHIGVGNFHRVHQAVLIDRCLAEGGGEGWAICGVGVVEGEAGQAKAEAFRRQDCLYTVTEFAADGSPTIRVIGSMIDYLHAPSDPEAVLDRLAAPQTRIVSLTITEGGYDLSLALATYDADAPPRSAFGFIVKALDRRRRMGLRPFTVMSCDNLRSNGDTCRRIVVALAEATNPALALWIEREGAFPNSMVDRIAPRVSEADRQSLNEASGIDDALPAICESYTNWVMEDRFCDGRPPFERYGVSLRDNVEDFIAVKGRLSNASHMLLAFPAVLLGYRLINEAMGDPRLPRLLQDFWTKDSIPLVPAPPGLSPQAFTAQVLERYANKGINDQVLRVAHDGTSKIVVFHAKTIGELIEGGRPLDREAFMFACFARYLGGVDDNGDSFAVDEPGLNVVDWALVRSGDPLAVLKVRPFAELRLASSAAFSERYTHYLEAVTAKGVSPVLDALIGETA